MPPRQVALILAAHARGHLDVKLIDRILASNPAWDTVAVREKYQHGVDWSLLREVMKGKQGGVLVAERNALRAISIGCFGLEERRWLAGLAGHGTCDACFIAKGTS